MIDDPDLGPAPAAQRRRPRTGQPDVGASPRGGRADGRADGRAPDEPHEPDDPVAPGWGDPFASYATLTDPDAAASATADVDASSDPWAIGAPDPLLDRHMADGADGAAIDSAGDAPGPGSGPGFGTGRGARRGPLVLTLLRPWFEPRPGELRGAIVVLSVALAVSLALWFDASRRPEAPVAMTPDLVSAVPGQHPGATPGPTAGATATPSPTPGRADGSDGWGLSGDTGVARGPVVHVSGAVERPGVVTVPERSRVADAIDAVGGAMPDARLDRLNLARIVEDGERIHVPRVGEDAPPPEEPASLGVLADGRIDLNAATQTELETLPGVGPARAQAIIAERESRPFRVPGDLRRVPGIGEATFQRLAPLVAVR